VQAQNTVNFLKSDSSDSEELPDLRELGFNEYEEAAIKRGFTSTTGGIGSTDELGSRNPAKHSFD
jgi:hypothetical protein